MKHTLEELQASIDKDIAEAKALRWYRVGKRLILIKSAQKKMTRLIPMQLVDVLKSSPSPMLASLFIQ